MATLKVTKENFESTIDNNDIVFIDFWATWCPPCKAFEPIYEEASEKYPDIVFGKINTDEEQELAASFKIQSIPTLMIFREKVVMFSQAGAVPASSLEDLIQKVQAVDMKQVHKKIAEKEKEEKEEKS
jgi:thioredoxin